MEVRYGVLCTVVGFDQEQPNFQEPGHNCGTKLGAIRQLLSESES